MVLTTLQFPSMKNCFYSSPTKTQTASSSYLGFALLCSSASSSLGQAIGRRILIPRNKEMNYLCEVMYENVSYIELWI